MRDIKQRFKSAGVYVVGLLAFVAVLLLCALFLGGMVWFSEHALPWLMNASLITLVFCVAVLLPLSFFRKTRVLAGNGYYFSSFVFGVMLFAYSCIVVYGIWGYGGLIFGLILAGVGVVPVAYLATILHGFWPTLGNVFLGTVLTFGTRAFGIYLLSRAEAQAQRVYE